MAVDVAVGDIVTVTRFPGVACKFVGHPPDEDDCDGDPSKATVVIVGDDQRQLVDADEVTRYDGPLCSCGQTGCDWAT